MGDAQQTLSLLSKSLMKECLEQIFIQMLSRFELETHHTINRTTPPSFCLVTKKFQFKIR